MPKLRFQTFNKAAKTPRRGLPPFASVFYIIAGASALIYLLAVCFTGFADFFNGSVSAFVRALLGYLTGWLPFSLAEMLVFCVPLLLAGLVMLIWRKCDSWRGALRFFGSFLAVCSLFFSLFVFSFGTAYHTTSLDERLGLSVDEINRENLILTAEKLLLAVNEAATEVDFGADGFSIMPYDLDTMNKLLLEAYDITTDQYEFIQRLHVPTKPVLASKVMSYTHITGVYAYFTGESNINTYFPDYTLPYTAAHELAHQRGIARENEANFVAFLVAENAEDPYIRYSGYLNLFEYVASALYRTDAEAYRSLVADLAPAVKGELKAYTDFFEQFKNSPAADLSDAVNDTYLKLHGNAAGTESYGLVVELAVAYFA